MSFPPGDTNVLDAFERADGNVWAGAGASLWQAIGRDGAASHLRVASGQLKTTSEGGGATTENVADLIRILSIVVNGGGFGLSFGYRMTNLGASPSGYFWSMPGTTWTLYRIDAGTFNVVGTGSVGNSLSSGARVGFRAVGGTHEVYVGSAVSFPATPALSFTDSTYLGSGAIVIEMANATWAVDDYVAGDLTAPTSPVTIIVDPDHADASDDYTRSQASNAATPLLTVQAAGWLARATPDWADTILVRACATADLGDANDSHLQPGLDYRSTNRASDAVGWPYGNNAGNLPITLRGDVVTPFSGLPKIRRFGLRGLANWIVQDIQFGYDEGSGHDYSTLSSFERVTDLTFERCRFTGGLGVAQWWAGEFNVVDCVVHSPLPPTGGNSAFHDGAGLRMERAPGEGSGYSVGALSVTGTEFSYIRGDDALTVGGVDEGDGLYGTFQMLVDRCLFKDVTENGPGGNPAFHTDAIQLLGVPRATIQRTVFLDVSDCLIASDGRNGVVTFENNLIVGGGSQFQMQGTDELVMRHNTFFNTYVENADATLLFYSRATLPQKTKATIVNNIFGGFFMLNIAGASTADKIATYFRTGSVIANNDVLTLPGFSTVFGANLAGISEFGHSARLDVIPNDSLLQGVLPRTWELANTPVLSPGIGQGRATDIAADRLGRAFASPPDVGCHQSDPATLVTAVARPPYVLARVPLTDSIGAPASTDVTVTLYPKPGKAIDPATVTTSTVYVTDALGAVLPAVGVALGAIDGVTGYQVVTLNVDGSLYPLATYTVHLVGVADTEGSALPVTSWSFRVAGPSGPAVYGPSESSVRTWIGEHA